MRRGLAIIREFQEFALKGSVLDMAVGILIGGAFNKIVNSLVADIIMPPIGLILGRVDFSSLFISLNGQRYPSLKAAQEAGAPTLNYGLFINNVISFLIVAFTVFLLVRAINRLRRQLEERLAAAKAAEATAAPPPPTEKPCPYCCTMIPLAARRCPHCTSHLEEAPAA